MQCTSNKKQISIIYKLPRGKIPIESNNWDCALNVQGQPEMYLKFSDLKVNIRCKIRGQMVRLRDLVSKEFTCTSTQIFIIPVDVVNISGDNFIICPHRDTEYIVHGYINFLKALQMTRQCSVLNDTAHNFAQRIIKSSELGNVFRISLLVVSWNVTSNAMHGNILIQKTHCTLLRGLAAVDKKLR